MSLSTYQGIMLAVVAVGLSWLAYYTVRAKPTTYEQAECIGVDLDLKILTMCSQSQNCSYTYAELNDVVRRVALCKIQKELDHGD